MCIWNGSRLVWSKACACNFMETLCFTVITNRTNSWTETSLPLRQIHIRNPSKYYFPLISMSMDRLETFDIAHKNNGNNLMRPARYSPNLVQERKEPIKMFGVPSTQISNASFLDKNSLSCSCWITTFIKEVADNLQQHECQVQALVGKRSSNKATATTNLKWNKLFAISLPENTKDSAWKWQNKHFSTTFESSIP